MINRLDVDFNDLPGRRTIPRMYKRAQTHYEQIDVSIITPYYNTEEFFEETFVSMLAQSLQNWEWVIVDDGSTDPASMQRLTSLAQRDERIRVIRQRNSGPSAARNKAFAHSTGRYVCLLDSDDMIEPTYLEKCVWFLESNPAFAFCNSYSVFFGEQNYLWTTGFETGVMHLQTNSGPPISVVRRIAYADCGGFDETIVFGHEDWAFWLAMAKAGHWGYTIPEFLQWYRKRSGGRFEQIMRSEGVNGEFERMMHRKYQGLDKCFPEPVRHYAQPYETIQTDIPFANSLAENSSGRRILFLIPWMVTGGADRVNLDLIEGLTERGHDVSVCASLLSDHPWAYQFSRFTPDVFVLPNLLSAADYPRFLVYLIKSRRIDTVVITGSTVGYQLLPFLRTMAPSVAFVDLCHVEEPHWWNGGHPRFGVGYQDQLELNIVTTRHLQGWMRQRGADADRIRVMYTGVRTALKGDRVSTRLAIRHQLGVPSAVPVIVFAGRLCAQKRPELLAEILGRLKERAQPFKALIIGDGEQKELLKSLLAKKSLTDSVQMLGSIPHDQWLDILLAADILLMPSQYEGISIALLEAIATGTVPVVAAVGGQDEIVSPDIGYLIPQSDHEAEMYVEALAKLIGEPSRLARMSAQCVNRAETTLSWGSMINEFLRIIDESHYLRTHYPRNPVSPNFARELANQLFSCNPAQDAQSSGVTSFVSRIDNRFGAMTPEALAGAKLGIILSRTMVGRIIFRSTYLKKLAKAILGRWSDK